MAIEASSRLSLELHGAQANFYMALLGVCLWTPKKCKIPTRIEFAPLIVVV